MGHHCEVDSDLGGVIRYPAEEFEFFAYLSEMDDTVRELTRSFGDNSLWHTSEQLSPKWNASSLVDVFNCFGCASGTRNSSGSLSSLLIDCFP